MRSLLLAVALAAAGLPGFAAADAGAAPPRIYRWVDENGIAHYTTDPDRIPKSLRRRFGLPAEPLRSEPLDARAPATPVPPAPARDPDAWATEEKRAEPAVEAGPRALGPEPAKAESAEVAALQAGTAPAGDALARLELRIAELAASIAADEDALSAYVGDPSQTDAVELADRPEFREIAARLPKRLQELEALRRERDALQSEQTP